MTERPKEKHSSDVNPYDDETPVTHSVWTPFFHYYTGKFRRWVEVGEAFFETDTKSLPSGKMQIDRRVIGYESGYYVSLPHGEKPQEQPPQEVIDAARRDAERRDSEDSPLFTAH